MKKIWAMALCLLMTATALAIPAKPVKRTITLADGTQKEVTLRGDENVHFYEDVDGLAYVQNADGSYSLSDKSLLHDRWAERIQLRNKHRMERAIERGMVMNPDDCLQVGVATRATWGATSNPVSGSKKGLVILVNFSDKSLKSTHNQSYYNDYFNKEGFSQDGMEGSVHDYFKECSYGKFDLTFDVVGPVTLSKTMSYYGSNNKNGDDLHPGEMVIEACKLADAQGADFTKYDWDGDGKVEQVFLVYAGYGENADAPSYTIWPHESQLTDCASLGDGTGALKVDGVTVDTYAVSCELRGSSGSAADGIGTACHEFSHCMCLPDMYDTRVNGTNFGMYLWDLMDSGSYNGSNYGGTCPTAYTSYERMYCGWLTPTELSAGCQVSEMACLVDKPEAYIIYNEKNRSEYYLLENRQKKGFDKYIGGHGMLVLHVDFDKSAWINNTVNNTTTRQRMTIIPADNSLTDSSLAGDPWPGTSKKTALTNTSSPAAKLYTANSDGTKYMNKPIEQIAENTSAGTISFTFNGGATVDAPVANAATEVTSTGFKANWTAVNGATSYEVELTSTDKTPSGGGSDTGGTDEEGDEDHESLLSEDFSKFNNHTDTDGSTDISEDLDLYTTMSGWEGSKVFTSGNKNAAKLGSSKGYGSLLTPWLSTSTGKVTVLFTVRAYKTSAVMYVLAGEDDQGETIGTKSLTETEQSFLIHLDDVSKFWVGLKFSGRAYVSEFCIYEGELNDSDFKTRERIARKASQTSVYKTNGTSYLFSGLDSSKTYTYRVRATVGGVTSNWSNSVQVELANGIHSVAEDANSTNLSDMKLFDMSGREVNRSKTHGVFIKNGKKILK